MSQPTPAAPESTPVPVPTPPPASAKPAEPTPATPPAAPASPAQETDWEVEAKKWEKRAKENFDKAKKLDEIEESAKTEAQKQAEALAKAEAKVAEFEKREQIAAWKAEVSTETGVPANVLAGSTKEEIEAHAATLKPLIGQAEQQPTPGVVPTIGKTPATPPNIPLGEQIAAAEREVLSATRGTPEHRAALEKVMALKGMQLREAAK